MCEMVFCLLLGHRHAMSKVPSKEVIRQTQHLPVHAVLYLGISPSTNTEKNLLYFITVSYFIVCIIICIKLLKLCMQNLEILISFVYFECVHIYLTQGLIM